MSNELLLMLSVAVVFGGVLFSYRFFGRAGLYAFAAIAVVLANIEVLMMVEAFGMEMTLGNVLFASTFLVTDILSELYGKNESKRLANMVIFVSFFYMIISQMWLLFDPAASDWASPHFQALFTTSARMILVAVGTFAVVQKFDVWMYHKVWDYTTVKANGDSTKYLWVRNNLSTLTSQLINVTMFTFLAFWGMYDVPTLIYITISSYIIMMTIALLDTPVIYLCRKWKIERETGVKTSSVQGNEPVLT